MIGLVGTAGRVAGSAIRGSIGAVLLVLLLGGAMALPPPLPAPPDGRTVLTAGEAPWGHAKLPDPQAQTPRSSTAAAVSPSRWKPSSAPWPGPESVRLADDPSRQPAVRRAAARRRPPIVGPTPIEERRAYDPHGPPFVTA